MPASRKKRSNGQEVLPLSPRVPGEIRALAEQLAALIGALPLAERVEALNEARTLLHEVSPFKDEPIDLVLWVRNDTVDGNEWNPNTVAPPEFRLLVTSIDADGYTQPIVTSLETKGDEKRDEVVDGFHRHVVGKTDEKIRARVHGYLPITRIRSSQGAKRDRVAATIRHNRARGRHSVDGMSSIVRMLHLTGWSDREIEAQLGMDADEVLRLKQITGLAALFADRAFSEAWTPDEGKPTDRSPR